MPKRHFFHSLLAASLSMLAVDSTLADASVQVVHRGTVHQGLFAINFDGQNGVAVGEGGEARATQDGGMTWSALALPTDRALFGVAVGSDRSIAVGQAGTILLKDDAGEWRKVDSGTVRRLLGVDSNPDGLAVAVGEFGTLQLSSDGGKSWSGVAPNWSQFDTENGAEPHLYAVDVSNGPKPVITATGEFGLVLRSGDKGHSWTVQNKAQSSILAIQIREDGTGFAVGQDGYALKTTDHGVKWSMLDLHSKAIFNGIYSSADGKAVITAMRELFVSSDDGTSWQRMKDPEVTTAWYVGVDSSGPTVIAVGQGGNILKVNN